MSKRSESFSSSSESSTHSTPPPAEGNHAAPSPAESVESVESNDFQNQGQGQPQIFNICALDDHLKNVREVLFGDFICYPPPPECHCEEQWKKRQEEEHKKISNCDCGKENCGCECCACCNSTKAPICGDDEKEQEEQKCSIIRTEIPECLKKVKFVTVQNAEIKTSNPVPLKCPLSPIAEMSCESTESRLGGCGQAPDINNNNVMNVPVPDANNNLVVEDIASEESIVVSELKPEKVKGARFPLLPIIKNIPIIPIDQVTVQKFTTPQCFRGKKKSKGENKKAAEHTLPRNFEENNVEQQSETATTNAPPPGPPPPPGDSFEKKKRRCSSRGSNASGGRSRSRSRSRRRCASHYSSSSEDDSSDSDSSSDDDDCGGGQENFPSEFLWFMLTMNSTAQYFKYNAGVSSQCAKAAAEANNNNCCCPQQSNGNCCPNQQQQGCKCNDPLTSVNVDTLDEIIEREGLNSFMEKEVTLTLKPFSGEYIPDNPLVDLKSLKMFAHGEKETDFCYETGGECECDKKKGKCCGGKKRNSDGSEDDEGGCCSIQLPPAPPCCCPNKLASEKCCGAESCAIRGGTSAPAPCCGTGGCSQVANCGSCGPPPCAPPCAPPQPCNPYNCYPQPHPTPPPPCYPYPSYQYPYPSYPSYPSYSPYPYPPYHGYPYPPPPYPNPPYHGYPYPPPPYPYYPQPCPPHDPCPNTCSNSCSNSCNPSPLELALSIGMSMGIERVNAALAGCDGYADENCDEEESASEGGTRSNISDSDPVDGTRDNFSHGNEAMGAKQNCSNRVGGVRPMSHRRAGRARRNSCSYKGAASHRKGGVRGRNVNDGVDSARNNFSGGVHGTPQTLSGTRDDICDDGDGGGTGHKSVKTVGGTSGNVGTAAAASLTTAGGTKNNISNNVSGPFDVSTDDEGLWGAANGANGNIGGGVGGAESGSPVASGPDATGRARKASSSGGTATSGSGSSSYSKSFSSSGGSERKISGDATTSTGNLESSTQGGTNVQMVTVTTDRNNNRVRFSNLC